MADDAAILRKVSRGQPLDDNEQFRYKQLAKEHSQRGSNIREFEKGNRKSPS